MFLNGFERKFKIFADFPFPRFRDDPNVKKKSLISPKTEKM